MGGKVDGGDSEVDILGSAKQREFHDVGLWSFQNGHTPNCSRHSE